MRFCNCVTSLEFRDPEIRRGAPNAFAAVKNKQTNDVSIFYIPLVFCAKYIDRTTEKAKLRITVGERANPFCKIETV